MRRHRTWGIFVGSVILLAGCSETQAGIPSPVPSPGPEQDTSAVPPASGSARAPVVANPLDATKFLEAPCSLLTEDQAREAGDLSDPRPDVANAQGPECEWREPNGGDLKLSFLTAGAGGLDGLYRSHEVKPLAYFEPVPDVAGYPGVFNDGAVDRRKRGSCSLSVGVRDDLLLTAVAGYDSPSPRYSNPCSAAQEVAEMAVGTMRGSA
ncbi:hypothetical protein CFN78_01185 [Amycolatopsis antarctica]|uniref:DUF3558 domain-containing protein n=1 Tax=Amycolatopsis antarctica TaxID=1854586 RepID=A0A263DBH4_9PSEU|nr:hypothetical protein CFN78_01185 [Amycolatopsis antarctica]